MIEKKPFNVPDTPTPDQSPILSGNETMSYQGGRLLQNVELLPIYLGAEWGNGNFSGIKEKINAFNDMFPQCEVLSEVAKQYSTPNQTIGLGTTLPPIDYDTNPLGPSVNILEVVPLTLLQGISSGKFPQPNNNTLYVFYTPPGTNWTDYQSGCAYHENLNNIPYAVVAFPNRVECAADLTNPASQNNIDVVTEIASHEIIESITDPVSNTGWLVRENGTKFRDEVGDLCAWKGQTINETVVQQMYNPDTNMCEVVSGATVPPPTPLPTNMTAIRPVTTIIITVPAPTPLSTNAASGPPVTSSAEKAMEVNPTLQALAFASLFLQTETGHKLVFRNPVAKAIQRALAAGHMRHPTDRIPDSDESMSRNDGNSNTASDGEIHRFMQPGGRG